MEYLVFRRSPASDDPFLEAFGGGDTKDGVSLPPSATTEELEDRDVEEMRRRDPNVVDVIPSIPLSLIEPVEVEEPAHASSVDALGAHPWGIEAVGATACRLTGAGVTVAVLDTGIDATHAAFRGLTFGPDDLMDFTVGDRPTRGQAPDQHGHGTHVAGTLFGRDVGKTRIGVASGVSRVLIARVIGPRGAQTEAVYRAIVWRSTRRRT